MGKHEQKRRWLISIGLYTCLILILTLGPFEFSGRWLQVLLSYRISTIAGSLFYVSIRDLVLNILFFVPLGTFLRGFELTTEPAKKKIRNPIFFGLVISGSIECLQLFLIRSSTITDLLANTTGCILGYLLYEPWFRKSLISWFSTIRISRSIRWVFLFFFMIFLLWFSFLPFRVNHLKGWSETFPLYIGNEVTGERPWQGQVRSVAIYGRALKSLEIQSLYDISADIEGSREKLNLVLDQRRALNGLVYYDFGTDQDSVPDRMGLENPLISGESCLKTETPVGHLVRKIRENPNFSIESTLFTENLDQKGPARIITVSGSLVARNFTLGQEGPTIVFRVRSPLAGFNGSRIRLISDDVLEVGTWHHIVAVYNRGMERIFVDGKEQKRLIRADLDYLPSIMRLGRNTTAQVALGLLMLIPLSFFLSGVLSPHPRILIPPVVASVMFIIQIVYYYKVDQPISWAMIVFSFLVSLGSIQLVRIFKESSPE